MDHHRFFVSTARGLEHILLSEVKALNPTFARSVPGGVLFEGPSILAWRANLWLRTGQRVLQPFHEFPCDSYDALYEGASTIRWEDLLTPEHTLAVEATCSRTPLSHSHHAGLKVKDAIVDRLRERLGSRPDVDVRNPDVRIHVYLHDTTCQLSLDLSGEPLFMRHYRVRATEAPLKETLAAGVIGLSGWNRRVPLRDPMCGSGTLVIEAALMGLERAPGRHRDFGFQRHPGYGDAEARAFRALLEEADDRARTAGDVNFRLEASDWDPAAIDAARLNARAAGVEDLITFEVRDVRDLPPGERGSWLVSNPPYGERMGGSQASVHALYRQIGQRLKTCPPQNAWLLCSSPAFESTLGMSARARHRLFNGPIETWLYGFGVSPERKRR